MSGAIAPVLEHASLFCSSLIHFTKLSLILLVAVQELLGIGREFIWAGGGGGEGAASVAGRCADAGRTQDQAPVAKMA